MPTSGTQSCRRASTCRATTWAPPPTTWAWPGQAAQQALGDFAEGPLGPALSGPLGAIASFGNSIDAGLGRAALVGPLSVPPSWTAPAPLHSPLSSTLGGHTDGARPAVAAGMPPVPLGNMAGQGFGRAVPQYGFRPSFVARPPAAG
jgi:PPE-repeat protein